MEEWSNAAEFEAIVAKAVKGERITINSGVTSFSSKPSDFTWAPSSSMGSWPRLTDMAIHTSPSVPPGQFYLDTKTGNVFVGTDTASQIRFTAGTTPEKQEKHMSVNSKTFEVVYEDGTSELIAAQSASEVDGRLTFLGYVEGVDEGYGNTVIKSVKAVNVASYRVVPKPETDAKVVGKSTYRVNFSDGSAPKDVKADSVLFQAGSNDRPGRYSLVTSVRGAENRTEYIVPEDKVASIERVENDGTSTTLPTPSDAVSAADNV